MRSQPNVFSEKLETFCYGSMIFFSPRVMGIYRYELVALLSGQAFCGRDANDFCHPEQLLWQEKANCFITVLAPHHGMDTIFSKSQEYCYGHNINLTVSHGSAFAHSHLCLDRS